MITGRDVLLTETRGKVFIMTVNREERRNAMSNELMDECMEWADYMCTLGQPSVRAHKQMIYRGRDMSVGELNALGRDLFYWYPPKPGVVIDATEGPRAFAEKRQPKY